MRLLRLLYFYCRWFSGNGIKFAFYFWELVCSLSLYALGLSRTFIVSKIHYCSSSSIIPSSIKIPFIWAWVDRAGQSVAQAELNDYSGEFRVKLGLCLSQNSKLKRISNVLLPWRGKWRNVGPFVQVKSIKYFSRILAIFPLVFFSATLMALFSS